MSAKKQSSKRKGPIIAICIIALAVIAACYLFFLSPHVQFLPARKPLTITIGHSRFDYPPLHYHENGEQIGFDIDLAYAVAEIIGAEIEFVRIDWSNSTEILESGEVDVLWGGLERASLDERRVRFTTSYLRSNIVLLMPSVRRRPFNLQSTHEPSSFCTEYQLPVDLITIPFSKRYFFRLTPTGFLNLNP